MLPHEFGVFVRSAARLARAEAAVQLSGLVYILLQERIETVGDDADRQEIYGTERHLLYVACTRARDHLLVTSVAPGSEFLDDMRMDGDSRVRKVGG